MVADAIPPPPARRRRSWYAPVAWGVCVLFLFAGVRWQPRLNRLRRAYGFAPAGVEDVPWQLGLATVALGGFRGLIVDMLWIRAMQLQEDDKYFEMVQLADWITKLEPNFATIWAMHAWNLAYNISVNFPDYEDRWRWVQAGFRLLRDQGIRFNPDEPELYRELGWIFQHKMGGSSDAAHWVYKRNWAEEMATLFGGSAPDFDSLAAAPGSIDELRRDAAVADLLDGLAKAGFDPVADWFASQRGEREMPGAAADLLADPARQGAAGKLVAFLRADTARRVYRLDPALMRKIDRERGPLDWRLPYAHAIYWATRGLEAAGGDNLACERMIFQDMNTAFEKGRLIYNEDGSFFLTPSVRIIPSVNRAYEEATENYPDINIASAHRNFMRNAILYLYTFGLRSEGENWLRYARERFGDAEFAVDLDAYVLGRVAIEIGEADTEEALALIEGALRQAFFWLAAGDDDQAAGYEAMARLMWQRVMAEFEHEDVRQRIGLPPIPRIRDKVLDDCLGSFPPELQERLRARLQTEADLPGQSNGE